MGRLVLQRTSLQLPSAPDLKLVIYTPLPEADTAAKLRRLVCGHVDAEGAPDARAFVAEISLP